MIMKLNTKKPVVYLSGGVSDSNDWRDGVVSACPGPIYLDPRNHGLSECEERTHWNMTSIELCDIFFACLAENNPSGYGLSLELGFAAALGKTIIFVEYPRRDVRPLVMARHVSDFHGVYLESGIEHLKELLRRRA